MSIIGNCIKTGAVVTFVEYDQTFACDLFQVADAIVIRFRPGAFDEADAFHFSRPVTHKVYVGNDLLDKRGGYAVVRNSSLQEVREAGAPS